jgi:hypothetical protein
MPMTEPLHLALGIERWNGIDHEGGELPQTVKRAVKEFLPQFRSDRLLSFLIDVEVS